MIEPGPLLHEDKLPGPGARGLARRLRHEPKLSFPHEVKLCMTWTEESNLGIHWGEIHPRRIKLCTLTSSGISRLIPHSVPAPAAASG